MRSFSGILGLVPWTYGLLRVLGIGPKLVFRPQIPGLKYFLDLVSWQQISVDKIVSTKYVYPRKHNKNEKAIEIMFCECNENQRV